MKIKANGRIYEVGGRKMLVDFILEFSLKPERCLVEYNKRALRFKDFKDIALKDGDELEIMSLVAGG